MPDTSRLIIEYKADGKTARLVIESRGEQMRKVFEGDLPFPSDRVILAVEAAKARALGLPVVSLEAQGLSQRSEGPEFPPHRLMLIASIVIAEQVGMNLAFVAQQAARRPVLPDGSRIIH